LFFIVVKIVLLPWISTSHCFQVQLMKGREIMEGEFKVILIQSKHSTDGRTLQFSPFYNNSIIHNHPRLLVRLGYDTDEPWFLDENENENSERSEL